jgi:hypothetical protein
MTAPAGHRPSFRIDGLLMGWYRRAHTPDERNELSDLTTPKSDGAACESHRRLRFSLGSGVPMQSLSS